MPPSAPPELRLPELGCHMLFGFSREFPANALSWEVGLPRLFCPVCMLPLGASLEH